jgi:predicted nucleotide-binding protein
MPGAVGERVDFFLSRRGSVAAVAQEVENVLTAENYKVIVQKLTATLASPSFFSPQTTWSARKVTRQNRARQNVILELGYFVGRLSRERVCVLRPGDVEIPSDFGGVVYEPFDPSGGWKSKLAKELEAAEYAIDWAKVQS